MTVLRRIALVGVALVSSVNSVAAQLVSTGASVNLNGIFYFISPFSVGKVADISSLGVLKVLPSALGFQPVTVVADPVPKKDLTALAANWTVTDDVFQSAFLNAIFLAGIDGSCVTKSQVAGGIRSIIIPLDSSSTVPSGPYFLESSTGNVYQAFRLYDDFAGAFSESLLQTPEGTFQPLSAQTYASATLTIGVPSRIYFKKTAAKPLAGVRVGVKDIFALAGVRGSNGNRAWYGLYPPATSTAPSMQRLIDAGAIIVGCQKPSQFANGESPTADWVDYHAPFNPRGDGYNDPSSSSSGAGASMGAYPWLDIAVGSDTGGSIRGPSGVQGLFGNRPSHGLVPLDNVMPLSPTLDTAGFLTRDPYIWGAANAALYGENYKTFVTPSYPKTIYTLGFPTNPTSPSSGLFINFANSLASYVGGTLTAVNMESLWASSAPPEAGGATLSRMLNTTYATLITKEQIALVRDPFYADYAGRLRNQQQNLKCCRDCC
jgi:hypothetical protein